MMQTINAHVFIQTIQNVYVITILQTIIAVWAVSGFLFNEEIWPRWFILPFKIESKINIVVI